MIRVFDFRIEGSDETVPLATMSEGMIKKFNAETQKLSAEQTDQTSSDFVARWQERRDKLIIEAMRRAKTDVSELTPEKLEDENDPETLQEMYFFILKKSGLKLPEPGEAKAAPLASGTSKAA